MKQKDMIVIIVTVFISALLAIMISKYFISTPKNRHEKVEVVTPIESDFPQPDKRYFNNDSIDPTRNISIGDSNNSKPFNSSQQ